MLVIRTEQMAVLSAACDATFRAGLFSFAREDYSQSCEQFNDAELAALIGECIGMALSRCYETEQQIAQYLSLVLRFGKDFETDTEWASALLEELADAPPELRIAQLMTAGDQIRGG